MPIRTLSSVEFQGSCSRDLNLGQSENSISGIYDQYPFCRCLTRTSLELSGEVKIRFFQLSNRKNVKFNIICAFESYVLLNSKAPCCKILNFHGLEIVFLEYTVNGLSVDASFLHN